MPARRPAAFPSKLIHIVTAAPGSDNDWGARVCAGTDRRLGQHVMVENRGGLGATRRKSQPDGHTLLFYGSPLWLTPFLRDTVRGTPLRDFAPVTLATSPPNMLVVHPSLPAKSVRELIALAKARPGQLNYAAGTIGAAPHLAANCSTSWPASTSCASPTRAAARR